MVNQWSLGTRIGWWGDAEDPAIGRRGRRPPGRSLREWQNGEVMPEERRPLDVRRPGTDVGRVRTAGVSRPSGELDHQGVHQQCLVGVPLEGPRCSRTPPPGGPPVGPRPRPVAAGPPSAPAVAMRRSRRTRPGPPGRSADRRCAPSLLAAMGVLHLLAAGDALRPTRSACSRGPPAPGRAGHGGGQGLVDRGEQLDATSAATAPVPSSRADTDPPLLLAGDEPGSPDQEPGPVEPPPEASATESACSGSTPRSTSHATTSWRDTGRRGPWTHRLAMVASAGTNSSANSTKTVAGGVPPPS